MLKAEFDERVRAARAKVVELLPGPDIELLTAVDIARLLKEHLGMCNCDLDNWVPLRSTGHSSVCALHPIALELARPYDAERARLEKLAETQREAIAQRCRMD